MSSETSLFEPLKCEIVDSFVYYTKLLGTKGKGEAWLHVGPEKNSELLVRNTRVARVPK